MKTFWKICGWGALAIVLLFALILGVVSPIAKYVVNNHGEDIVGRELHADQVIINPFWGGVSIHGFECKEANGETNFISFDRLYVQIAYPQLLAKRVKIRAIHLDGFNGQVLKSHDRLNFSDIVERFSPKDTVKTTIEATDASDKSPWTIALDDIRINNSSVRYRDVISDKQWKVEDISLRIPGVFFDNTQTNAGLEFGLPTGGRVGIIAGYKMQSNRYAVRLNLEDVHTDVALPLVQDYLNVSGLGAKMNGNIHVDGSLDNITNIQLKGRLAMTGLSIKDTHDDQVAAMDELRVVVNKGDLNTKTFILDSLILTGITGDYEVHESWNTLSRLLKKDSEEATDSVETSKAQEVEPSTDKPLVWMAKKVLITGHDMMYHDYSMKHEWEYGIQTLEITGDNIATNGRNAVKIDATLTSDAKLKLDFIGGTDLAHQDTRAELKMTGVQLRDFSALCRNYTGYPLNGGDLRVDSRMDVVSGKLKGTNRIIMNHPRVGRRDLMTKAKYKDVPVRLGVKMLTSAQDIVVLDVPVTGDATNPKFNLNKVIGRALLKVFFGPMMGVNDRKNLSEEEIEGLLEILGEDAPSLSDDSVAQLPTDITTHAGDSSVLSEISE